MIPLLLVRAHLLGQRGLVVGELLIRVLPFLGHGMPAHQSDLADQLLVIHDVFDHPLGLLGALLMPRVYEEEPAVADAEAAAAGPEVIKEKKEEGETAAPAAKETAPKEKATPREKEQKK